MTGQRMVDTSDEERTPREEVEVAISDKARLILGIFLPNREHLYV